LASSFDTPPQKCQNGSGAVIDSSLTHEFGVANIRLTRRIICPRISKGNGFVQLWRDKSLRRIVMRRLSVENAPIL
jgi:hypothetical protein